MGRLVQSTRIIEAPAASLETAGGTRGRATVQVAGDQFTERLVKYIPAEVIGAYLSLENLLDLKGVVTRAKLAPPLGATEAVVQGQGLVATYGPRLAVGVFLLGLVCTPVYIWQQGRSSDSPWLTHAIVATLAFVVWAYAMGGSFFLQSFGNLTQLYDSQLAAAALVALAGPLTARLVSSRTRSGFRSPLRSWSSMREACGSVG